MIVVSNTTPLIGLAIIERFDLLEQLFGEIYIPQAVYNEVVVAGKEIGGAKREVASISWIKKVPVKNRTAVEDLLIELDLGEAETIILAQEINADLVLMDEKKGRQKLSEQRRKKIGTVGILLKAKQEGILPAIRDDMMKLREMGFSISQPVIDGILEEAGEK